MIILMLLALLTLGGCASKPVTPTEVQMIVQLFSNRIVAEKLSVEQKARIISSIQAVKLALESTPPTDLVAVLRPFFSPKDQDIADLIGTLLQERVDLTVLPELEGKAYVWAVLDGIEGGLLK